MDNKEGDNMYFPDGQESRPNSNVLSQSIRSKQESFQSKGKSSLPYIARNDSQNSDHDSANTKTIKRNKHSSKMLSLKSHKKASSSIDR